MPTSSDHGADPSGTVAPSLTGAEAREARKALARVERRLERAGVREQALHDDLAAAGEAVDVPTMTSLGAELDTVVAEREALELEWLELAEALG